MPKKAGLGICCVPCKHHKAVITNPFPSCAPRPGQPKGIPVPSMTLSTDPASCWMWIMPETLTLTTFPWGTGIHRQDQSVGKEEMESRNNVGVLSRAHKALALNTHQSWVKTANIYLCISLHK